MTFKLEVISEIEREDLGVKVVVHSTVTNSLKKYEAFNQENQKLSNMCKIKDLQIFELE